MLSVGESLALATLFVTVVFGAFGLYNSGYRSGARSIPVPPGPQFAMGWTARVRAMALREYPSRIGSATVLNR